MTVTNLNFLTYLQSKDTFNSLEDIDLYVSLKEYESTVLASPQHQQIFRLSEVERIIHEFNSKIIFRNEREDWRGSISHADYLSILNLSLTSPRALMFLSKIMNSQQLIKYSLDNQRKCLILTDWGFPFGGAEAFFEDTSSALFELGFKVEWGNFQIPGIGSHPKDNIIEKERYTEFQFKDFASDSTIRKVIKEHSPDIIFSHGAMSNTIRQIAAELGITLIEGFHFWDGLVNLANSSNSDILQNLQKHELVDRKSILDPIGSQKYLVSNFMFDIYRKLGGLEKFQIIDPSIKLQFADEFFGAPDGFVSQLDLSIGKGGHIFCDLVERLGDRIPFLGVIRDTTEPEIMKRLEELAPRFPLLTLQGYSEITAVILKSKLILVPSLVDETYSRVTEESVRLGLPVLTSLNGNLKYLLDGVGAVPSNNSDVWEIHVANLYSDEVNARYLWMKQSEVLFLNKGRSQDIVDIILNSIRASIAKNVGVFAANGAQGLGTLAKVLAKSMNHTNLNTYIFAFKPYQVGVTDESYWKDLKFLGANQITISDFVREEVPVAEILEFIDKCELDIFIFPEVCWVDNWARLYDIKRLRPQIRIVIIPMLETVVKHEIAHLNDFGLTLFPTKQTMTELEAMGVRDGVYVGFTSPSEEYFGIKSNLHSQLPPNRDIKFLHIGGHNPTVRKQTLTIILEFLDALKSRSDISLTITLQNISSEIERLDLPKEVTLILDNLNDLEIADLYLNHDVSIQIPSHEGIGIGFYESISLGTPVVTIDSSPHNEVVVPYRSGWLLPAVPIALPDNPYGVVGAAKLLPGTLTNFLIELEFEDLLNTTTETKKFYQENFSNQQFSLTLLSILSSKHLRNPSFSSPKLSRSQLNYEKIFNLSVQFGKKQIYSRIPFSTNQKFKIREKVLLLDRLIRKLI
jgi:glycosyltransferase involved in cell wall biosynthesis